MPGFSGHGAKFWVQRGNGSFYRVGAIMDVSGPSLSTADVDITTNDSPAHTKEFIASLIGGGEVTFPTLIDVARFNTLRSYQVAQATLSMALLLPSVPQVLVTCDGYVKGLDNSVAMEEAITSEMTLMVTNAVSIIPQPVGPLTLTPAEGNDNTGGSPAGADQTSQIGYRRTGAAGAGVNNATFGTLAGDNGASLNVSAIQNLYYESAAGSEALHLRIDGYAPTLDADDPEWYLRIGDDLLYRARQNGSVDSSAAGNFIYSWDDSTVVSSPFTAGAEITVQVFAE